MSKKTCAKCNEEKNSSEFRKDARRLDGLHAWCKICARGFQKSQYVLKYSEQAKKRTKARFYEVKKKVDEYKQQHGCYCCVEGNPVCLEFHHLNPKKKDFTISGNLNRKWEYLLREMQKCIVICANCHRKIHAGVIGELPERLNGAVLKTDGCKSHGGSKPSLSANLA